MHQEIRGSEIVFQNVTKTISTRKKHTIVLHECSFSVEEGKLTVLLGPSGCGKTTILNLIAGYETPDRGTVSMDGDIIRGPDQERLMVFQEMALFPWLTCYENIVFGPMLDSAVPKNDVQVQALELLRKVGLFDFRDKYPAQLSGGMQRRAELARALINRPKVMLLDEPFRGLDAMTSELIRDYYLRLFEETHISNLFVSSDLDEAIYLADRVLLLTNAPGRVKNVLDIDLPRPREKKMLGSRRFVQLKAEALEVLYDEMMKTSSMPNMTCHAFSHSEPETDSLKRSPW